ncbi:hypothetical protein MAPG_05957 [Magnaporthiopsis poae ATCC 64411]|uniref:Copper acquisition factor BIM1-like domain-containing protein n=1 Tax=Magnaporthiopsis poae (strain ATCC 64411 / 73-15) TaxID=644358 RepID=A0A0C4E0S3_MAGP6|nr:hypothetical protein MAPG_05957 [Magnaporthiopsis poae ATCC 64411]
MKCSPLGLLLGTAAAFRLNLPEPAYIQKTDGSLSKESGAYPPCGGGALLGPFSDYPRAGSPLSVTTDLNECIWAVRAFRVGEDDKDLATLKYIWQTGAGSLCIPWLPDTSKLLGSFPDGVESTFSVYQLSKEGRYQYQCAMVYFREDSARGDVPESCSNSTGVQARFIEFDEIEDFRNPSNHSSATATSSSMTSTSSSTASSTSSSESATTSSSSESSTESSTSSTESSSAVPTSSSSSSPPPITLTSLVTSVATVPPSTAETPAIATTTVTSPSQPPSISATALPGSNDVDVREQDRQNFVIVTVLASAFGTILLISLCCCGCCFFRGGCGDWSYALASRVGLELPRATTRTAPTTRVAAPDVEPGLPFNITVNNKN